MSSIRILPLEPRHRGDWERLYANYAVFYRATQTPEMRQTVWGWIMDPANGVRALVAEDQEGRAVGFTHYRPFARPLSATTGGFIDDLFVSPDQRGARVADLLIDAVAEEGARHGWSVIRWLTADDNYRARCVYDRLAARTMYITYDKKPG